METMYFKKTFDKNKKYKVDEGALHRYGRYETEIKKAEILEIGESHLANFGYFVDIKVKLYSRNALDNRIVNDSIHQSFIVEDKNGNA